MSKRLLAIYTGGTIGMQQAQGSRQLAPAPLSAFLEMLPFGVRTSERRTQVDLGAHGKAEVDWLATDHQIDSANIGVNDWRACAHLVATHIGNYDGCVLLHGTDSMAYTASALSFTLKTLGKPVVLTGAQKPVWERTSDAVDNILLAFQAATMGERLPEVCIAFAGRVLRGNRSRKVHTTARVGFDSPNYPPLGRKEGGRIAIDNALPRAEGPLLCQADFSVRVANLFYTPGMQLERVIDQLQAPDIDGMVLHTLGSGNLPTDPALLVAIEQAVASGRLLLSITQCQQGGVDLFTYTTGVVLAERGVVSGKDMTPEAATTKLMWALAFFPAKAHESIKHFLCTDQAGELGMHE